MPEYYPQSFSTILNIRKEIDPWFWDRYSVNPYTGCSFGCVYCDARSDKYKLPLDFEEKIGVKTDADQLLDHKISGSRTMLPDVVTFSGVTDAYQPAEHTHRITRKCLEILLKHKYPVHIITKSKLVEEDLELISEIGRQSWAAVSFSIPTIDEKWSRFLDKNAPPPATRLKVLETFRVKAPHVHAGVLMIPIVPEMGSSPDDLKGAFQAAQNAGSSYLLASPGMTLRDQQARWFFANLEKSHPEKMQEILKLYYGSWQGGQYHGAFVPERAWQFKTMKAIREIRQQIPIPDAIPRFIPNDWRADNYRIAEKLFEQGRRARESGQSPVDWDQAGQQIQQLKVDINVLIASDTLRQVVSVTSEILAWILSEGIE